jgi:uncharacterized membrane protein YeaQ/YmgE (transglycosylase-associated protein family)
MTSLLQIIPSPYRTLGRRIYYFLLGTGLTFVYAQLSRAQAPTSASSSPPLVQNPYSLETIIAAVIGAIITIFFLRGMYLVLTYASETYGFNDDTSLDVATESKENNALIYGLLGWVIGSALIITSYGWGWGFLYVGPIVCLLGPVVPIVAMNLDIKKYREILASHWENHSDKNL